MMRLIHFVTIFGNKSRPTLLIQKHFSTQKSKWIEPKGYVTEIQVYNTATKCKVPLTLRYPSFASWYMCGPTVYDSAHIGHACCYVKFDIMRRILENFFNINIVQVMSITDIDDKIITRAAELQQDIKVLTNKYEREFFVDMNSLNIIPPSMYVRVTDVIPDIVLFIQNIIRKGMGYVAVDGSVYFDTAQFNLYGKLFPIAEDENKSASPKKSSNDFALWKNTKPGEPFWASPWGNGRPGWHIECSAIASKVLGSIIDMHSGGIDLVFPHHENEEAQSCAQHGVDQWVNYWLHSGLLHLKGDQKMSKSLHNTMSIQEFLASNSSDHFRMLCLLSRYRYDIEYSDASLVHAKSIYRKIESFLAECDAYIKGYGNGGKIIESELLQKLQSCRERFLCALADDFDTPKAITTLVDLISECNKMLHSSTEVMRNPAPIAVVSSYVRQQVQKLGIQVPVSEGVSQSDINSSRILDMVVDFRSQVRETAIKNIKSKVQEEDSTNLMKACDLLRDGLTSVGVEIKDHKGRSTWNLRK